MLFSSHIQPENGFCVTNSPTPAPTEPRTDVDCKCSPQEYELLVNDYPLDLASGGGSVPVDLHKLCQSNPLETGDGIPGIRTTTEIVDLSSPELTAMCYVCTKDNDRVSQQGRCDDITREELAVNVIVRVSSFVVCI